MSESELRLSCDSSSRSEPAPPRLGIDVQKELGSQAKSMPRGVDVVGCDLAEGGRSCVAHEACGKHVKVGDVLLFREEVDDQGDNRLGYCLKAYLIRDGSQTCHPIKLYSGKLKCPVSVFKKLPTLPSL
ncbi:hypothetical protein PPTG_22285 [Phytophthora nicotianae INRA-310]|uniref:Uncharacterized protein n=1 Tax=Phytophthora nicotianae (strain INRA-310) TaxID=761204 RepID=W2QM30_PHYN3|nr:hypothetical protein PPTG_22285 [Phytophthora nicotianae INRA-310]ETN13991.1 hypothetical protein PPTG_22285 [Phytophthora nicotianae INRA-310]